MKDLVNLKDGKIVVAKDIVKKIVEFNKVKQEMEYQERLLKEGLMEAMQKVGIKNFCVDGLFASIKSGSTRTTIDSKRLKEECPEIFEAYSKTTEVKPSIVLKIAE